MKSLLFAAACLVTSFVFAADPFPPQAVEEHGWLKQFVGEWESKAKGPAGPGEPEVECTGSIKSRMLGNLWVVSEIEVDLHGSKMKGLQTIGYDPKTKKYVGTWVDSMMNHLWKYEGSVDATGKILTLEAEGPNFMGDGTKMAKFRDVYEFKSKDQIAASSQMLGEDGKWVTFMTGTSVRAKAAVSPK